MISYTDLLKQNKCFCKKKQKNIHLGECQLFDCPQWKSCMRFTNKNIAREAKK